MAEGTAGGRGGAGPATGAVLLVSSATVAFGLLFGFSTAIVAGVLDDIAGAFALDTGGTEAVVAVLVAACFVGAILASPLSARLGRRSALGIAAVLGLAGYAAILLAPTLPVLVAGRIAIGLGVGLSSMVAPMYAAEATPARVRGAVVSLSQLAITSGILAAYATPLVLADALAWNGLVGSGIAVAAGCLAVALAIP